MTEQRQGPEARSSRSTPPGVPDSYPYPDVPVTRLLDDAAKDFPETDAIDVAGHRLSYRQVLDQVDRLAAALRALGIEPGERVGLLLPHSPQHLVALFASLRVGATAVLLDPQGADLREELSAAGCRAVVCLSTNYPRLATLKGHLPTVRHILATGPEDYLPFPRNVLFPVTGRRSRDYHRIPRDEGVTRFKDLIRRTAPEPLAVATGAAAVVAGGLVFDHQALVAGAFQLRLWVPDVQAGRERLMSTVPPSDPLSLGVLLGLGVLAASTMVFPPRPERVTPRAMAKARPTLLAAGPEAFRAFAADPRGLDSLRVGIAGQPVDPASTAAVFEATGGRVRGGLAVPGVPGLVHANPVYGRNKAGSAGLPLPDTHTVVLDAAGAPLPAGAVGAVGVRGPQVTSGHFGTPGGTVPGFSDPWLPTGHRGRLDGEGYLWLEQRE